MYVMRQVLKIYLIFPSLLKNNLDTLRQKYQIPDQDESKFKYADGVLQFFRAPFSVITDLLLYYNS